MTNKIANLTKEQQILMAQSHAPNIYLIENPCEEAIIEAVKNRLDKYARGNGLFLNKERKERFFELIMDAKRNNADVSHPLTLICNSFDLKVILGITRLDLIKYTDVASYNIGSDTIHEFLCDASSLEREITPERFYTLLNDWVYESTMGRDPRLNFIQDMRVAYTKPEFLKAIDKIIFESKLQG